MYECPNCNANLKFDIPTQMLLCDRCGTSMDPYAFHKGRDAEEHTDTETMYTMEEQEYEVTVFTCPQCGGELISDDNTAATFCNFCGGATILDSRISREKRPASIIPFKKTREDCEQAYVHMMRRALFAPRELKKKEYISRFRSIYMPYWIYKAEMEERVTFGAKESRQSGDYMINTLYRLHSDVEEKYNGFYYDASSTFSDALSNAIAPFDWTEAKEFTPAFLSGFYADAEDVDPELYKEDVQDIVAAEAGRSMEMDPTCRQFTVGDSMYDALRPKTVEGRLSMFPVWFLAYRYKDRVSYMAVNGQTGKAAGTVPVDKKRFVMGSVLLALPLFILFNLLFAMKASTMVFFAGILGVVGAFLSIGQKRKLKAKEDYMDDKGSGRYLVIGRKSGPVSERKQAMDRTQLVMVILMMGVYGFTTALFQDSSLEFLAEIAVLIVSILFSGMGKANFRFGSLQLGGDAEEKALLDGKETVFTILKPGIGVLLAVIVLILQPRAEVFYYGAAIAILVLMGWNALELIEQHNILSTRPLPQFKRRGGENDGK